MFLRYKIGNYSEFSRGKIGNFVVLYAASREKLIRHQSSHDVAIRDRFVVNVGNDKVYIQSALNVDTPEKKAQETFSLRNTGDFFRKIVVLDGNNKLWADDDGVMYVGVIPFLLDDIVAQVVS